MLRRIRGVRGLAFLGVLALVWWWLGQSAAVWAQAATAEPATAVVIARGLNVRSGPAASAAVVGLVSQGDQLAVLGRSTSDCAWLLVRKGELQGWVSGAAQYVTLDVACNALPLTTSAPPTNSTTPEPAQATPAATETTSSTTPEPPPATGGEGDALVRVAALNLRSAPGTRSAIVGTLHRGDVLRVLGRSDDACSWLHVTGATGVAGWVTGAAQFIDLRLPCAAIALDQAQPTPAPATAAPATATPAPTATPASGGATPTPSGCPSENRLQTGVYQWHTSARGDATLTVNNGFSDGLVSLLTLSGERVVDAFLWEQDSFTITGLPRATYKLQFVAGEVDCNGVLRGTLHEFDDEFDFGAGDWTVTLDAVRNLDSGTPIATEEVYENVEIQL